MEQHKGPMVEEFKECVPLDGWFTSSLDKWNQFAMEKGPLDKNPMAHDDWSGEDSNPSHGYNSEFKFLKILNFCYVDVTVNTLQYFLLFGAKSLVNLRVVSSSIALKYLVIYASVHLKRIEIRDANLVSFWKSKVNYRAGAPARRHVTYLIKNLVALEKIVIDIVNHWRFPSQTHPPTRLPSCWKRRQEMTAMNYLKRKVPSSIEFVCL
ncbi:hypothetical protein D8674_040004 [Pyrus ussuriensis x Pyrus communis]|uniref:FBD domain-containing protein n=1 Tax=Pyrus ussuriensis x Pyrus communis TaxID=2448454 RepID=A0A5N5H2I6_9ROSA|nr:hypothetical protein D8674_040004 [Pyrus ussuriensis x Pyrus communis]